MKTIKELADELVEDFSLFGEWVDKYAYIIDLGRTLTPFPEKERRDENKIEGCQSNVWLTYELNGSGELVFFADSDALITKGIIALLLRVFSCHKPEEIYGADVSFIDETGLSAHLSPTRANGLREMINKIKTTAKNSI